MAFVITQSCCNDASCVPECPVDCIRPTPEDPEFVDAEMLYIDPDTCIDCGACVDACPVDAIFAEDELSAKHAPYAQINADWFTRHPLETNPNPLSPHVQPPAALGTLRVAIVGSGPAACYAADELLTRRNVEVEMFERLPAPWGLVRYGVSPDHPATRGVVDEFAFKGNQFAFHLNVEVGKHVSHDELLEHHHAVIYAVGAATDRQLGIPGEDRPLSHSATEFVAWYNGHPDYADRRFDLSGPRAVVVGNGNVALDVARILTTPPDELARTDIADHALEALRHSGIREVVVLGRRGPVQAAYTSTEFLALGRRDGVDVVVDAAELAPVPADAEPSLALKVQLAHDYAQRTPTGERRIVFRYNRSPVEIHDGGITVVRNELVAVHGRVEARPTADTETIDTTLVLRSVGYRGTPVPGLPFDDAAGVVPNDHGRVAPRVYVTGWIKRGPRGFIGTNRACAEETVDNLLDDFVAGKLDQPPHGRAELNELLTARQPERITRAQWQAIDRAERERGKAQRRPRVKFVSVAELVQAGRS